jgi:hypothetical protein
MHPVSCRTLETTFHLEDRVLPFGARRARTAEPHQHVPSTAARGRDVFNGPLRQCCLCGWAGTHAGRGRHVHDHLPVTRLEHPHDHLFGLRKGGGADATRCVAPHPDRTTANNATPSMRCRRMRAVAALGRLGLVIQSTATSSGSTIAPGSSLNPSTR